MKINRIGQIIELQAIGGGYFTESFPTNFHHFYKRKALVGNETADMFMDVTEVQKSALEAQDAKWVEPDEGFITHCKSVGVVYNRATGFFELNGLTDITEGQMRDILLVSDTRTISKENGAFKFLRSVDMPLVRTLLPLRIYDANITWLLGVQSAIETVVISHYANASLAARVTGYDYCFTDCKALKTVEGVLDLRNASTGIFSGNDIPLEKFYVITNKSLKFDRFPKINLASLQYLVAHAENTSQMPFPVHPDVYAKLTDEDAELQAYLPENLAKAAQDDGWTEITLAQYEASVCRITNIADIGLRPGDNVTVAIDAKSLSGRRLRLYAAVNSATGERLEDFYSSDFIAAGSDGRLLLNFVMPQQAKDMWIYISNVEATTNIAPQQEEYKGLKISIGEHPELPYTEPFSKIEDEALREKAEWLSLMQIAEARQIEFVTTA